MFGAKRKPRKIGQDGEDGDGDTQVPQVAEEGDMPKSTFKTSSKSKRKSGARTSFGLGGTSMNDDEGDDSTTVFTPKKSSLSRQTLERATLRKSLATSIQADQLPPRQPSDNRPSYTADALSELKSSTPSTPQNLKSQPTQPTTEDAPPSNSLDLASKFGTHLALTTSYQTAAIPTNAEIAEKKARRARLAKEHDFISLEDDNDSDPPSNNNNNNNSDSDNEFKPHHLTRLNDTKPPKHDQTRLIPQDEDEDIAEGFDSLVGDPRLPLSRRAEKEAKARQKAEIRDLIHEAEGSSSSADNSSSNDDSEKERLAAYETAQTRAGLDGLRQNEQAGAKARRPRTPPRITALPSLAAVREKLMERLEGRRAELERKKARLEEVRRELGDVAVRKVELQRLLDEAGERLGALKGGEGEGMGEGTGQDTGMEGVEKAVVAVGAVE